MRSMICALAVLGLTIGLAAADEVKGKITKIDDKKVTVATGKKGAVAKDYDIAPDCKFFKALKKNTKTDLAEGVKNEAFKNLDPANPKAGVTASLNVVDGKVTEITVGGKKKKAAN
jgi:hypothetical protein